MPADPETPHVPVLLGALLDRIAPVRGHWLDGTLGAGGYTRALLDAGADKVTALDRDPSAIDMAQSWAGDYGARLDLVCAEFGMLDTVASGLDGVVLDLGVSSMQLDQPERGFSFQKDGPLDMRMGDGGQSAADLVNTASESALADILYHYGEERAARRIARAIVAARPLERTGTLSEAICGVLPRAKPGQSHPATRSFQALRIAVNDEYGQLFAALAASERALRPGGLLAVVTFHSTEDRMVKRFMALRSGKADTANRHAPPTARRMPQFHLRTRRAIGPDRDELARNPRARSARLRIAERTDAPAAPLAPHEIAMPLIERSL